MRLNNVCYSTEFWLSMVPILTASSRIRQLLCRLRGRLSPLFGCRSTRSNWGGFLCRVGRRSRRLARYLAVFGLGCFRFGLVLGGAFLAFAADKEYAQ